MKTHRENPDSEECQRMTRENERAVQMAQIEARFPRVSVFSKVDFIRNGWWTWDCEVEYFNGTSKRGTIQSDGHMHAIETFEAYEEQEEEE